MIEQVQEFIEELAKLAEEAEKRRAISAQKWELYKVEQSKGEKKAYEDAGKKLAARLTKYLKATAVNNIKS